MSLARTELLPWGIIHDRECPNIEAVLRPQRRTGIEAHTLVANDGGLIERSRRF
jgi:hypothetical protein